VKAGFEQVSVELNVKSDEPSGGGYDVDSEFLNLLILLTSFLVLITLLWSALKHLSKSED